MIPELSSTSTCMKCRSTITNYTPYDVLAFASKHTCHGAMHFDADTTDGARCGRCGMRSDDGRIGSVIMWWSCHRPHCERKVPR